MSTQGIIPKDEFFVLQITTCSKNKLGYYVELVLHFDLRHTQ